MAKLAPNHNTKTICPQPKPKINPAKPTTKACNTHNPALSITKPRNPSPLRMADAANCRV